MTRACDKRARRCTTKAAMTAAAAARSSASAGRGGAIGGPPMYYRASDSLGYGRLACCRIQTMLTASENFVVRGGGEAGRRGGAMVVFVFTSLDFFTQVACELEFSGVHLTWSVGCVLFLFYV